MDGDVADVVCAVSAESRQKGGAVANVFPPYKPVELES